MEWKPGHPAFQRLLRAFLQEIPTVYVVGGVVRDHLLGVQDKVTDLDLAVDQPAIPVARQVADALGWAFYPLDEARDVARLVFTANTAEPLVCDVARVRGESIENDLLLRDFTINAMAFAVQRFGTAELIDHFGGRRDLEQQLVRRVSAASLADDPARLLRAIRFAVQFGFALDEETRQQIKQICTTVTLASAERVRDELWKMMATDEPATAIEMLDTVGLLVHVLPEVAQMKGVAQSYPHFEDVYQHTLRTVRHAVVLRNWILGKGLPNSESAEMARWLIMLEPHLIALRRQFRAPLSAGRTRAEWLVWAALLHDIGKPETRTEEQQPNGTLRYRFFEHEHVGATMAEARLTTLRFSRQEIALVRRVVALHMRPHLISSSFVGQSLSRRAKFRFFRDAQGAQAAPAAVITDKRTATNPVVANKATPATSTKAPVPLQSEVYQANQGVDTLCLAIADYQAIHRHATGTEEGYLTHSQEMFAYIFDPAGFAATQQQPLLDGHTLMKALKLPPGRLVGQLLAVIQEAQAAGEVDTKEAALALAAAWLQEHQPAIPV